MPTTHILCDIADKPVEQRLEKSTRLAKVFELLGYDSKIYSREVCSPSSAMNAETQLGAIDGYKTIYSNAMLLALSALPKQDLIITTEPWHHMCFRELCMDGKYYNTPVIEAWIDYDNAWADNRIYTSTFTRAYNLGQLNKPDFIQNWLVALPYYKAEYGKSSLIDVYDTEEQKQSPFSTAHLKEIAQGIPVVGPDWGALSETIKHGITGVLYRSELGRKVAKDQVKYLPSKDIKAWAEENLSAENAKRQIEGYIGRLTNV